MKKDISRREFLKLAGIAASGLSALDIGSAKASVAFGGDTLLGGYYSPYFGDMVELTDKIDRLKAEGGLEHIADSLFGNVKPIFEKSAFSIVNLEGPIIRGKSKDEIRKGVIRKFYPLVQHEDAADILKHAGINMVTLANNHMYDFRREEGLKETIDALDGKLYYIGAGDLKMAYACKAVKMNNINIGFIGVTDVLDPEDMYATQARLGVAAIHENGNYRKSKAMKFIVDHIEYARNFADFVVVMLHAGPVNGHRINARQKEIADILIESSADVVIGAHSHAKQPIKEYKKDGELKQVVFYGIGNLVFGGRKLPQSISTIPVVDFHKDMLGNKKLSYKTHDIYPNGDRTFTPILLQ